MSLRFDHIYTVDMNQKFRNKLKKAGFKMDDRMVEHPGKAFCRFIMIPENKKSGRQYLEFIHLGNSKDRSKYTAGLSMSSIGTLTGFSERIKGLKYEIGHKNYNWKENSKDRLPGWNFLSFPKHKSRIYTWLTEYEKSKTRKVKSTKFLKHPNQIYRFVSIEAEFDSEDIALYSKLLGRPNDNQFILKCGTVLRFKKAEKSKINAVVLATKNLKQFVKRFVWDHLTMVDGMPAVQISNPNPRMWDILIIQE